MYIIKIMLCLGILEISTYLGMVFSKKLDNRVKEYTELQNILIYIKTSIEYLGLDIIQIFEELYGKYKNMNFGILFKNILDEIRMNNISLKEGIEKSVDKYAFMFSANLDILKELGNNLGKSDTITQINNLCLYEERLKEKIAEATENKKKKEKMYKSLGIICGIMLVIVLI
ncbi:MAG: hypothetical protein E7311_07105 [Clostridiales bacterium]|nr:hypothetical protein [Clostridiales bacterium]